MDKLCISGYLQPQSFFVNGFVVLFPIMTRQKRIIFEIILLIASVMVFRALWLLLDLVEALNSPVALVLTLIAGLAATIMVLFYYHKEKNK